VNTPARCFVGLLLLAILFFGGLALLRNGVYGWTLFVLFPVFLGGLACWVFRPATGKPREDDDKGWWRDLVERLLDRVSMEISPLDRDTFFEAAYGHFAEAGVWELYPDVEEVLETLAPRFELAVVSNFDSRLRVVLHHLGIAKYFRHIFLSSELGADKPDPLIYQRTLELGGFRAEEVMHVGDDPERDWEAASRAGLAVFRLERPHNSLRDLLPLVARASESS